MIKKHWPLFVLGLAAIALFGAVYALPQDKSLTLQNQSGNNNCNIAAVSIEAPIDSTPGPDNIDSLSVANQIRTSVSDSNMLGFVLYMNSGGGAASAAEEISSAIKDIEIPKVTFVRGLALSGGYWIASNTDYIVAMPTANIGSIGVTSSYLDETKLNLQKGYTYEEIVAGEYKDVGNVNKPLTAEGKAFLQKLTNDVFKLFKTEVKQNRGLSDTQITAISDAKFYLAAEAKTLGLIDQVGGMEDVKNYFAEKLGKNPEEIVICDPYRFAAPSATQSSSSDSSSSGQ